MIDEFVKSRETPIIVIPAEAGIQSYQIVPACLDSDFHRSDDFLRNRQHLNLFIFSIQHLELNIQNCV